MAQEILVPEVSDGVTEGTVISVAVAVGDKVEADQTLLEMETDKAVVAIPSPFDGVITEIKVADSRKGSTPMSSRRGMAPAALLVCSVLNTRWPVREASMPMEVVSLSRISPTMMTSGSCRRACLMSIS